MYYSNALNQKMQAGYILQPDIYEGLLSISAATIDHLLASSRIKCKRFCGTKPGSLLKPINGMKINLAISKQIPLDIVVHR